MSPQAAAKIKLIEGPFEIEYKYTGVCVRGVWNQAWIRVALFALEL